MSSGTEIKRGSKMAWKNMQMCKNNILLYILRKKSNMDNKSEAN